MLTDCDAYMMYQPVVQHFRTGLEGTPYTYPGSPWVLQLQHQTRTSEG